MKLYKIGLHGCDDSTYIKIRLSEEQKKLIDEICHLSEQESHSRCMPIMEIEEQKDIKEVK